MVELSMKRIIAACGNDCSACPRYVAHPYEKTQDELRHTAELWMRIGYRDHVVSMEEISCMGCKPENWCRYHVVKCCQNKGIQSCAECGDYEVLGAAVATMLSNVVTLIYFIAMFRRVRDKTPLVLPRRIEKIGRENARSLYSVGIPAAIAIFLFDLVTIVINRLIVSYGDVPLAAMGIVLKLERIPVNIGLGVCLGMVPLVAYNYAAGNHARMKRFVDLARIAILGFSFACVVLFWFFARPIVGAFIKGRPDMGAARRGRGQRGDCDCVLYRAQA